MVGEEALMVGMSLAGVGGGVGVVGHPLCRMVKDVELSFQVQ